MTKKYELTQGQVEESARAFNDVQDVCGVNVKTLLSPRRDAPVVLARFIASASLRGAGWTYQAIADAVKWKDHASVIHASKRFDGLVEVDKAFLARARKMAAKGWTLQGSSYWMGKDGKVQKNA